jgi:hypothetical protein
VTDLHKFSIILRIFLVLNKRKDRTNRFLNPFWRNPVFLHSNLGLMGLGSGRLFAKCEMQGENAKRFFGFGRCLNPARLERPENGRKKKDPAEAGSPKIDAGPMT